jgi:carbamoylphosphate synthase large subunit
MQVLGTPIETIIETEDRELFSKKLLQINESLALSYSATSLPEALRVAEKVPFTHPSTHPHMQCTAASGY